MQSLIELNFFVSPEDHARLQKLIDKMGIAEREFLYRALTRYLALKEKEFAGQASSMPEASS